MLDKIFSAPRVVMNSIAVDAAQSKMGRGIRVSLEVTAEQVHDVFLVRSRIEGSDDKANYDELFKVHR